MDTYELYATLEKDIKPYNHILNQAADAVLDQDVSSYPIFIFAQESIEIGLLLIERDNDKHKWEIHASTLEELVTKKIIEGSRVDNFRSIYKDPREYLCLFVLSTIGATFVFLPRTKMGCE